MGKDRVPSTPAILALRKAGIAFSPHLYNYVEKGGAKHAAEEVGADLHEVIKTLIFQDEDKKALVVLMHGDCQVSAKALARAIGKKRVAPCPAEVAERRSGYRVGGTSPFGLKQPLPIYLERSVCELDRIYLNGGSRGLLISMATGDLITLLEPEIVDVAIVPE